MKISLRFKKLLSFILTFSIILSLLPSFSLIASASTVTVLDGKISLTDTRNNIKVSNGVVTCTADGGRFSSTTNNVTIENKSGYKIKLNFDFNASNQGSFNEATLAGNKELILEPGGKYQLSISGKKELFADKATLTLSNFVITPIIDSTVKLIFDSNKGSVTVNNNSIDSESSFMVSGDSSGLPIKVIANEGFQFFGWKIISENNYGTFFSYDPDTTHSFSENIELEAVFISSTVAIFGVGNERFVDLNEASIAANSGSNKKIVLLNNGTLPAGNYEIPAGVTLLIPRDEASSVNESTPESEAITNYAQPTAFRTLTMASGANITVKGKLCVNAKQSSNQNYTGHVVGEYGCINMSNNSTIKLENGSKLYAWGYIIGSGNVIAESGSSVYEDFQLTDFRGGDVTSQMASGDTNGVFPMSQYYVQNIEVPLKINSGASVYAYMSVNITLAGTQGASVPIVGPSGAMFKVDNGYIVKDYIEGTGRLEFEIHGDVSVSPISLSMKLALLGSSTIDSKKYILPIPGHMTVRAISGNVTISQDIALFPGSELYIGKDVYCKLASGKKIIVYDLDQWGKYCWHTPCRWRALLYAPGGLGEVGREKDALVQIDGYVDASEGYVYTTVGLVDSSGNISINPESKANIYTTGTGKFITSPGSETTTYQLEQNNKSLTYHGIAISPVILSNGDGTYVETSKAETGSLLTMEYQNGKWVCVGYIVDGVDHIHRYNSVVTDFTCTEKGYTTHTCEICGDSNIDTYVPASHRYSSVVTAPTCTEQGYTTHTCTVCGDSYIDTYVPASHRYSCVVTAPTCTERGYTTHTCTGCGDSYIDNYVDATGHSHNAVVIPPTCTEQGYTTHTCHCGDTYVDNYVDATGHNYDAVVIPPTCTERGYTTHTCHCGDAYVDNYVDATGHSHNAVVTPPTCTEQGYTTHTCHCGDTYVDNYVDETGHLDNNHDHVCENGCNEQIGSCEDTDFDHDCDYGCGKYFGEHKDEGYDHNCDYGCKEKIGTCEDRDFDHDCDYGCDKVFGECSDSDSDNDHVCDYGCGAVLEECKDTDTDNDHNCDICGKQNVTEHDYTYGEYVWNDDFSSCTRTRTCNCTYTETPIAKITSIVKSPATCEGKGWTTYTATFTEDWAETQTKDVEDIEPLGHRFTNESDSECDYCEYTRAAYIGVVSYVTFEDALAAAKEGDTIVVLSQIVIEGERSLDLTGITLDSKYINFGDYAMVVRGDLTIVGGTFNFENYYGIGTTANGKLTINGGKYSTTKDYYLIGNFGETVINDGEFTSLYCNVNSFDGTVIINGGKFTVTDYSYPDYPPCDVFAEEEGVAIIKGGVFSTDVTEHCSDGHTLKDEDGNYPYEKHSYDSVVTDPTCTVEGKTTHTCECGDSYEDTIVAATGHSYDDDFDATCNNGCGYVREAKILVAMIGNNKFDSLSEAVNTAKDGETIVLCKDVTLTEKLVVATTQKWDFGSYTVTLANGDENYSLVVKGDLTIESGTFVVSGWYGIGVTGKLTVNNGKIEYSGYNDYLIGNWGETAINGGVFNGQYCCVNNFSGTTVINDGKFTTEMKDSTGDYDSCDLFADSGLSVNGGNFSKDVTIYCDNDHHTCDVDEDGRFVYEKHSYDSVVTDPTCTEEGYTTYTCHCGDSYVGDNVDATGHDYAEKVTDPTCTEEGYTTYTCHCGDSYVGDYVDANGHGHGSFGYDLYKHWSICSVEGCGTIFDEEAHDFINDACKCGAKRVSVNKVGNSEIDYTVIGQTVTVTHEDACTVAYIVDGKYVKLEAVENIDGSYSFTAPDGVENVALLVIGDYDADGVLTEEDAYSLRNAILGKETLNDTPEFVYDVNGDQKITALDLALISAAAQRSIKLG